MIDPNSIVVDWAIVTLLAVPLGYVANLVGKWIAAKAGMQYEVTAKKAVTYLGAVGLAYYFAVISGPSLPPIADDPAVFLLGLLSLATAAFKVAQQIYDRLWQKLPVVGAGDPAPGMG